MPNIIVRVPENTFDATARLKLAKGITDASKQVEQIGDDPRQLATILVVIEEIKAGHIFAGGSDPLLRVLPVIVQFFVPEGVLDEPARADAARLLQAAVTAAKPEADTRPVITSVIISTVADGTWGVNGALWHLDDFTRSAGYRHLQVRTAASA